MSFKYSDSFSVFREFAALRVGILSGIKPHSMTFWILRYALDDGICRDLMVALRLP